MKVLLGSESDISFRYYAKRVYFYGILKWNGLKKILLTQTDYNLWNIVSHKRKRSI